MLPAPRLSLICSLSLKFTCVIAPVKIGKTSSKASLVTCCHGAVKVASPSESRVVVAVPNKPTPRYLQANALKNKKNKRTY